MQVKQLQVSKDIALGVNNARMKLLDSVWPIMNLFVRTLLILQPVALKSLDKGKIKRIT